MPDRRDWPLIALACAADGVLTPLEMQKTLFLIKMEANSLIKDYLFYSFVPYNYGPFDSTIYRDIAYLEANGDLVSERADNARWSYYTITKRGMQRAAIIAGPIDQSLIDYMMEVVDWVKSMAFPDLLRAIYKKYPEYAVNSVFNK
jgi:hypothetical protein